MLEVGDALMGLKQYLVDDERMKVPEKARVGLLRERWQLLLLPLQPLDAPARHSCPYVTRRKETGSLLRVGPVNLADIIDQQLT